MNPAEMQARIVRLECAVEDMLAVLEDHFDTRDGPDGPMPNWAMIAHAELESALRGPPWR